MREQVRKLVRDRLAMVRYLIEANHPLSVPADAGPTTGADGTADGGWIHTHAQLDGLVSYLLLTCFDALGQNETWVDFNKWLTSSDCAAERQDALGACADMDAVCAAQHLLSVYNAKYGARRSFLNFIDNILPSQARKVLLESIRLIKITADGVKVLEGEHKKKKDELYRLRNRFTHEARIYGISRLDDGSRLVPASSTEPERGPFPSHNLYTEENLVCMVHDWPFSLYAAVCSALGDPVPDFQVEYTVVLDLNSGRTVLLKNTTRADLLNPATRAELFKSAEERVAAFLATTPND